jgi:hypothetical protein
MRPVIFSLFLASVVVLAWPADAQARKQCPLGQREVVTENGTVMCEPYNTARKRDGNGQSANEQRARVKGAFEETR